MAAEEIADLIRAGIPDAEVEITDLAGDGDHYAARVVSAQFRGVPRVKQHQAAISAIKKGDEVITGGGIRGKVTKVIDDNEAEIEIAQGIKVRVVKGTISQVITPQVKPAND